RIRIDFSIKKEMGGFQIRYSVSECKKVFRDHVFGFSHDKNVFWTITSTKLVLKEENTRLAVFNHNFKIGEIRKIRSYRIQTGNSPEFYLV
ncbi:MAG: hypothetical protein AAFO91_01510, partial [Bacteroidota bacterium]